RGNRFCTPLPRMNEAPKADGGRWGPKGAHQTAQGHQAIFELSADGSIVERSRCESGTASVKGGSPYRRQTRQRAFEALPDPRFGHEPKFELCPQSCRPVVSSRRQ
ncbi:MAG: hypothetical protein ACYSO1_01815, partial [Planctomycetota bacterium]